MERYKLRPYPSARTPSSALYLCVDQLTERELAVKVIGKGNPSADRRVRRLLHGVQMVARAGPHQNLIAVHGVYDSDGNVYVFMDYAEGGTLLNYIKRRGPLPEVVTIQVVRQLLEALAHLHGRGVMHRDIKAENILIREPTEGRKPLGRVCICDYGFATCSTPTNECVGSPGYCAPEIALIGITQGPKADENGYCYDEKCDIWSLGVTTYAMLSGQLPFTGGTPTDVFKSILRDSVPFSSPTWGNVSHEAKKFVLYLMTFKASNRPSARAALGHPWLVV
ncbi:protein kinase [Trypanosoma brucei equiperdum]|uniref:Protein kinase n=1 Tax=Trypanosoma brucei equiperdum TaxID=630700 RepID=A0A3L6LF79_9TRYP|nr:protein kinase [Trypanosoma brucei equiperdum]